MAICMKNGAPKRADCKPRHTELQFEPRRAARHAVGVFILGPSSSSRAGLGVKLVALYRLIFL